MSYLSISEAQPDGQPFAGTYVQHGEGDDAVFVFRCPQCGDCHDIGRLARNCRCGQLHHFDVEGVHIACCQFVDEVKLEGVE